MYGQNRQEFHGFTDTVPQVEKIVQVSGALKLAVRQQIVRITGSAATGNYTITLPSCIEAAGLHYSFRAVISGGAVVTLVHAGDSEEWTNRVFDTDGDSLLLFCDGFRWWVLVSDIA